MYTVQSLNFTSCRFCMLVSRNWTPFFYFVFSIPFYTLWMIKRPVSGRLIIHRVLKPQMRKTQSKTFFLFRGTTHTPNTTSQRKGFSFSIGFKWSTHLSSIVYIVFPNQTYQTYIVKSMVSVVDKT